MQAGLSTSAAESPGDLAANFAQPPQAAGPWVYWFWCNGNVTKEGITADLEAMKRVGIAGVLIMETNVQTPAGPAAYNGPLWHELNHFAITEAARLGLQVNMTNAPGWCGSGGPWNTPEHSEQKLVWTETRVQGPKHIDQNLATPQMQENYYGDIALLAYPTPDAENVRMAEFSPTFSVSGTDPQPDLQSLGTPNSPGKKGVLLPRPEPGVQPYVQVEFAKPFTARTLTVWMRGGPDDRSFQAELQSSDDGVTFKPVRRFGAQLIGIDISFEPVTARYFRLVYTSSGNYMPVKFGVTSFTLSPRARVDEIRSKSLVIRGDIMPLVTYPTVPSELTVDPARLVDISSKMDANGHVIWDVPAGNWTLLRMGHTSHGVKNHPAPDGGLGLECDKLSREAVDAHFAALMGKVIADVGPLAGKTLTMTHIDSWETGTQNWTGKFRDEFKARRGYDLLPYLPAITGMVVGSVESTERFLWDFRQTAAELLADNYSGRMEELAKQHGMRLSIEAYGDSLADNATYGARADEPMCEFWRVPKDIDHYSGDIEMPSVAHVYGKQIIGSEAFTSDRDEKWMGYPGDIKPMGDWAFTMGINRFVFHRYAMQPWIDVKPGMSMGPFGLHYERTETWWDESGPWHEYLARCQYLLQQGLWVADICHVAVERAPNGLDIPLGPGLLGERPGYNYDAAPAEAVITRFSVRDGRIVLPDGMSYRVLNLPNAQTMTPGLLNKIKQLVADGATVIGPKPLKSPSLSNYPACDAEIKSLADEVWGDCNGNTVKEHAYGKGRVIWGKTADEVLREMNVPQDFTYSDSHGGPSLLYAHHLLGDTDFYFVANKQKLAVAGTARFRVDGKRPEFWWPETGKTEPVAVYSQENGVTTIPMQLDASQSVFVVFQPQGADRLPVPPVASVTLDGQQILPLPDTHPVVVIQKASYGPVGDPVHTRDVQAKLQAMFDKDHFAMLKVADVATAAGDPAPGIVKTLTVDYTVNGEPHTAKGIDSAVIAIGGDDKPAERVAQLGADAAGHLQLEAWKPGAYEVRSASGNARQVSVGALPPSQEIPGQWQATFPFQKDDVTFEKLASWTDSPQPDVKYFSGTATYHKSFQMPAGMLGGGHRLYLDLGDVEVNAEVTLNGKNLGILWKAPYRVEITDAAKEGENALEIKVTNLWPNRQIGDQQLPPDSDRAGDGSLKSWPQWLVDGKPDPTGRKTFTNWTLWNKDDALVPSGLIGPVMLRASAEVPIP
jgi:hypothetical protein